MDRVKQGTIMAQESTHVYGPVASSLQVMKRGVARCTIRVWLTLLTPLRPRVSSRRGGCDLSPTCVHVHLVLMLEFLPNLFHIAA